MTFPELISYQHTRLQVVDIHEKKIRKVFDDISKPKKGPVGPEIMYCFEPLEPKPKSKNGAFTIEGARALSEMVVGIFATERPVVVVLGYPKYGEEAQNALLKLLEESPSNVFICLLYTPETSIIPTIASRSFDLFASSPFVEKTTVDDFRQKMTAEQIIHLQKVLAKAGNLPESWISDFKKAVKNSK